MRVFRKSKSLLAKNHLALTIDSGFINPPNSNDVPLLHYCNYFAITLLTKSFNSTRLSGTLVSSISHKAKRSKSFTLTCLPCFFIFSLFSQLQKILFSFLVTSYLLKNFFSLNNYFFILD